MEPTIEAARERIEHDADYRDGWNDQQRYGDMGLNEDRPRAYYEGASDCAHFNQQY